MKKIIILFVAMFTINIANAQWVPTCLSSNFNSYVWSLAVNGNNIFAGTYQNGLYMSSNNGVSWTSVPDLEYSNVDALASNDNFMYAGLGCSYDIYISTNNGYNWHWVFNSECGAIFSLALKGDSIFAGTGCGYVYLSTNNGASWDTVNNGLPISSVGVNALAIIGNNIFAGGQNGIYLSTNNGDSWINIKNGLTDTIVHSLAVIGNNIFAGTSTGIYLSSNNGNNWTTISTNIYDIKSFAIKGSKIYASYNAGVVLSSDNGDSWVNMSNGYCIGDVINALVLDSFYIYAGTYSHGIYKCPLSDFIGQYTIATYANPSISGSTSGINVDTLNQSCTIKATPNTGYAFVNWTENGNVVSTDTSYTFNVTTDRILTANFSSTLGLTINSIKNFVNFYPNPTKDYLTIETNLNIEQKIEIINLIGQTVYTIYINKKATINTSAFASGVYILKLYTDKETVIKKFVKE